MWVEMYKCFARCSVLHCVYGGHLFEWTPCKQKDSTPWRRLILVFYIRGDSSPLITNSVLKWCKLQRGPSEEKWETEFVGIPWRTRPAVVLHPISPLSRSYDLFDNICHNHLQAMATNSPVVDFYTSSGEALSPCQKAL